jgi:AcrR family transcriptional regulator
MPNVKNNASSQETRRKLIAAAGKVFADKGLYAATLQEITDLAGANKASVNYHFRDKCELYAAVVRQALTPNPANELSASEKEQGTPEEQLAAFVTHLMKDLLDPSQPSWRATIIGHELAQPTAALDAVMTDLIEPKTRLQHKIVRAILGPSASEEKVARMALSVAAQCIFYLHSKEIIRRMYPTLSSDDSSVEAIATHITEFSLAALRSAKRQTQSSHPSR